MISVDSIKVIYSEADNGFIATIPDLQWCSAFGETEEEAIKEIKIVRKEWLRIAKKEKLITTSRPNEDFKDKHA